VYYKTNILNLQSFHTDKFTSWASNGGWVEETWKSFKENIFESINRFVPHKIMRKNPDHEYYNREVKRLKAKVRIVYI
jgi:hypothetical protein